MREILFRGKTLTDKWVAGAYYKQEEFYGESEDAHAIITSKDTLDNDFGLLYSIVIPETVGQYTGLTDKNGTRIFEGDIVKFGINQRLMYVHWNEETLTWELTDIGVPTCEVNHLSNTFDLGEIQVESAYGEMFSEVIGNIHDNPELLKGGAE